MKLIDLPIGSRFIATQESGGFIYTKTDKVDRFGSILCIDPPSSLFYDNGKGHWHSRKEEVVRVKDCPE